MVNRDALSSSSKSKTSDGGGCRLRAWVFITIPILWLEIIYVHKFLLLLPGGPQDDIHATQPQRYSMIASEADGTFNGYPIKYQEITTNHNHNHNNESVYSTMHCVGETNEPPFLHRRSGKRYDMSWSSRSCHFQFFCYDLDTKDFVLYQDPKEAQTVQELFSYGFSSSIAGQKQQQQQEFFHEITQTVFLNKTMLEYPFGVSIGSINQKWTHTGINRLNWFPRVRLEQAPSQFYALPSNVALIPFHSLAAFNPGHLVWDDFLPLYTLLQIFQLDDHDVEPMYIRYQLPGEGVWAGCDWKKDRAEECQAMLDKFGPLMVRNPAGIPIRTQNNPLLTLHEQTRRSNLVCAKHGLAGLGSLSDHGVRKGHGWEQRDYGETHNHGRGGQLWRFRNYMIENLGLPVHKVPATPLKIIFSLESSKTRSLTMDSEIQALEEANLGDDVLIESYKMKKYSLREQVEMVGQAAIYVTACGGGAVTASFLPNGASLILFYGEDGGIENNKRTGKPARLDWDYFNNMAYTRVHWLGRRDKGYGIGIQLFVELVRHELELIRTEIAKQEPV